MQLRRYQLDILADIQKAWDKGKKKVVAQLSTGGGKTVLFAHLASNFAAKGQTTMILAHREELVMQAKSKVLAVLPEGSEVGVIKSGVDPNYDLPIQIASVQTLLNRLDLVATPDLLVIDECHHSKSDGYLKILQWCANSLVLGVSATPIRLDKKGFDDTFDCIINGITTKELIQEGHLSRYKLFADPTPMVTGSAKIISGDYNTADLAENNNALMLAGNVVKSYERHAGDLSCIIFGLNIEHSIRISEAFGEAGYIAAHLDGSMRSSDRREILMQFARKEIQILTNCALFDEGLDIPGIEAVIIAKPTKSLSRYLQMLGRGLRPAKDKEFAVLIDHTNNWVEHGLPCEERIWTLEAPPPRLLEKLEVDENGQVVAVALEPDVNPDIEENLELALELPAPKLVEITAEGFDLSEANRKITQLLSTANDRGYKKGWVLHRLAEKKNWSHQDWELFARRLEYQKGWAWWKFKDQELERLGKTAQKT